MIGAFIAWSDSPRSHGTAGWLIAESGCHLWAGARGAGGYGLVMLGGRKNRRVRTVHRLRYEREVGPVPEGMELDHFVCNNPSCCNPAHLRPVTPRENSLRSDGQSSLNAAKTHCPNGHPLSGDNLRSWELRVKGVRLCRACYREVDARRKRQKRRRTADLLESLLPPREHP